VSQLISLENYFAALVKEKGIKKAFLKVSDDNTIVFRPGPTSAEKYFKKKPDSLGSLVWEPTYARIAKSDDWGITSGPSVYKESDTSKISHYGHYLSIWKKNSKGIWRLAVDLGIQHPKPKAKPEVLFVNPKNQIYLRQRSQNRLQQREDVVFSSDRLMSTTLKAEDELAFKEFVADDSQLLFPGYEPIIGKKAIIAFWKKQGNLSSEPVKADRAYSGELAYTHGDASIILKGKTKKYHYVRIWEIQQGYVWKVIYEIFVPAAKEEEGS
jgi:ketosteroid isomerase-like protein